LPAILSVIWETRKRLRDHWCLVQGTPEHHPEGTYQVRYRVNGKRTWEGAGDDPERAVSLRDSRLWQLKNHRSDCFQRLADNHPAVPTESEAATNRLRMNDEVKTYLANVAKLSRKTHKAYKLSLTLLQQSCSKTYVDQIKKQDLQGFDTFLKGHGDDDRTRANRVSHIVTFLRNREGRRNGAPVLGVTIKIKYVEAPPEPYTRQELEDLFRVSCDEDKMLWRFLLGTGFRENEASVAEYSDINAEKKLIYVVDKPYFGFKPKDCEKRAVPMPDDLIARLKARKNGSNVIFANNGKPDGHLLRRLKSAAFKGGLNCGRCTGTIDHKPVSCADAPVCENWILHKFRKNFATDRHEAGATARQIQKWLGHESLETTLRYLATGDDTTDKVRDICNDAHAGL
jgi:integrase/recombinase XerD